MNKTIHKRTVSLVLAFMMAVSCTFNIAAADSGNNDYVDSQKDNTIERVYDSGNVVLSNQLLPVAKNTFKVKLNIDIKNIKKFLEKDPSTSPADETAGEASPDSKQTVTKDSGATASASDTGADLISEEKPAVKALRSSVAGNAAIASRALADTESEAAPEPAPTTATPRYEVRYYIENGFQAIESSIPENATLESDGNNAYVSWSNLNLDEIQDFTNSVQVEKDASNTDAQILSAMSTEQASGLYLDDVLLYEFAAAAAPDDTYYVPVNFYKYDRTSRNGTMAINQACKDAAAADKTTKTKRTILFDKATSDSWNGYTTGFCQGLVSDTLDANGNLQWNETSSYKYIAADLFGSGSDSVHAYRTDYPNVAFPLKKDGDNYSFDSINQRATYNSETNTMDTQAQNISSDQPQFSPFYSGDPSKASSSDSSYSFGLSLNMQFTLPTSGQINGKDIQFTFSGDDDVWVYVDNKLVLDLGGIHQREKGVINFKNNSAVMTDYNNNNKQTAIEDKKDGKLHSLTIFYLERGAGMSNFYMSCNLPQSSAFEVGKKLQDKTAAADKKFSFEAKANDTLLKNVPYQIFNISTGANTGRTGTTTDKGIITLAANEKAVFSYLDDKVLSSIAGKDIRVKELGAEEYSTSWVASTNSSAISSGNGKESSDIQAPSGSGSVETESLIFTNRKGPDITAPLKTAVYTGNTTGDRTYAISLTVSTKNTSTDPSYDLIADTPGELDALPQNTTYYSDENGSGPIKKVQRPAVTNYSWVYNDNGEAVSNLTDKYGSNPILRNQSGTIYYPIYYNAVASHSFSNIYVKTSTSSGNNNDSYFQRLTANGSGTATYNGSQYTYTQWYYGSGSSRKNFRYGSYGGDTGTVFIQQSSSWVPYSTSNSFYLKNYEPVTLAPKDANSGSTYYVFTNTTSFKQVKAKTETIPAAIIWCDANTNAELPQAPTKVYQCIPGEAAQPIIATIRDTIDPRFEAVSIGPDNKVTPLTNGAKIAGDNGIEGTLTVPGGNQPEYVTWVSQTLPVETQGAWQQTIQVRAKLEFLGGNDIPTNVTTSPDPAIGSYVSYKDLNNKDQKTPFNEPTVNVPINFAVTNQSKTIFLGEKVGTRDDLTIQNSMFDVAAGNSDTSPVWCGKGKTGDFSAKWYYDGACTNPAAGVDYNTIADLSPSEQTNYYLQVTFSPKTDGSKSAANGASPVIATSETGTFTVCVKNGTLVIKKKITNIASDPGRSFVFLVTGKAPAGCKAITPFYVTLTITGDNVTTAEKTITGLSKGEYTVKEVNSNWQYTNGDVLVIPSDAKLGYEFDRSKNDFTDNKINAVCVNEFSHNQWFSATDSVANLFKK